MKNITRYARLLSYTVYVLVVCGQSFVMPRLASAQTTDTYKNLETPFYDPTDLTSACGDTSSDDGTNTPTGVSGPGTSILDTYPLPAQTGTTGQEQPIDETGKVVPGTGHVSFAKFAALGAPYRDYYINMRWDFAAFNWDGSDPTSSLKNDELNWMQGDKPKLLLVTNPKTNKSIIADALETGPGPWVGVDSNVNNDAKQGWVNPQRDTPATYHGLVSGMPPKALSALGINSNNLGYLSDSNKINLLYSWAPDQNAIPGPVSLTQTATTTTTPTTADTTTPVTTGSGSDGSDPSDSACCDTTTAAPTDANGDTPGDGTAGDFIDSYSGPNAALSAGMAHGDLPASQINTLVIHYTEGNIEGSDLAAYFNSTPDKLGVQFNIGATGKVYQYFPLKDMKITYHAKAVNDHAIGIEITGKSGTDLIANKPQFAAVVNTVKYLCDYYNIPCKTPKGDITGTDAADAQGLLGHDEAPSNDHTDPDTDANGNNIATGKPWTTADRSDSSIHAYMKKLRTALGYPATPGSTTVTGATTDPASSGACAGVGTVDGDEGDGTAKNPVGDGPNRDLALEAVKYDTATNPQYTYEEPGMGHGSTADLDNFAENGGTIDCSGFVRMVIWRVYHFDVGSTTAQDYINNKYFQKIDAADVAAGDVGVIDTAAEQHIEYITGNNGGGKLTEFGAHSVANDLYGGPEVASHFSYFLRYIGPKQ